MNTPPIIQPAAKKNHWPPSCFAGAVLLLGFFYLDLPRHLPIPQCGLRAWTGLPCPLCGSTRALLASAQLQFIDAFRLNPLITLILLAVFAWFLVWSLERLLQRPLLSNPRRFLRQRFTLGHLTLLAAALLILNWIYLCLPLHL